MRVVRGGLFWQFGSIASLASYRNYRWGDSSSFFGPNMASEAISECLILKIFLGEYAPDPSTLFTLKRMQWPYQSKIVGAGPDMYIYSDVLLHVGSMVKVTCPPDFCLALLTHEKNPRCYIA